MIYVLKILFVYFLFEHRFLLFFDLILETHRSFKYLDEYFIKKYSLFQVLQKRIYKLRIMTGHLFMKVKS